ncbi:MAG: fibronectin type III domain-containing protein [Actinomycetota bacterium]|nr:fibronectin type III domain-containing protein [Actinomycetota bacterium]
MNPVPLSVAVVGVAMLGLYCLAPVALAGATTGLPDLTVARAGPSTVGVGVAFIETLTIANHGTATTSGVAITYTPPSPTVFALTPGVGCAPVLKGHSGRGGGYTRVAWLCTAGGLAAGASEQIRLRLVSNSSGTLSETFSVAPTANGAQLNMVSHTAAASVSVIIPPKPAAPTNVTVNQSGDTLAVAWQADPATSPFLTSSLITATPVSGTNPVLSANGTATSGAVTNVQPLTTYSVTVVSFDAGGASPASAPVLYTTAASTVPPGAPTILYHWWTPPQLAASWAPGSTGDSPIDQYEVTATNHDGDTPVVVTQFVSTTSAYLTVDDTLDWIVTVRAHNAAGWGPWSASVLQGGL